MNSTNRVEQSRGRDKQGRGRMGGPKAGGTAGTCRCPNCDTTQAHERGIPCMQVRCPQCGSPMVRV